MGMDVDIRLIQAAVADAVQVHSLQTLAFKALLDKYKDYSTNPGAESVQKVAEKIIRRDTCRTAPGRGRVPGWPRLHSA